MRTLARLLVLGAILAGLAVPLADLLGSPERLSTLASLQVDSAAYDRLAADLAHGASWSVIPIRQPPGFVSTLALVYAVFGRSYVAAKLLLWACLVATTALAGWLARAVWGSRAAWTAALLTATAPALRHYVGTVQYEVLVAAELLATIAVVSTAITARAFVPMAAWAALGGLAAGALALTREVFVGVVPIIALWLAWRVRPAVGGRRALVAGALFLAVATAPVVWWSARQSARAGQLVVLSDKGPVTFAFGNNPAASGTYTADRVTPPSGLRFLRERPRAALRLFGRKALYFWGAIRDPWNVPRPAGLWLYRASGGLVPVEASLPLARGGWLLLAWLAAVVHLRRSGQWHAWWILPAVVAAVFAAHVVTLSSHRFAVPVLPIVFVLAAGPLTVAAVAAWKWLSRALWRRTAAAAMAVLFVALQWWGAPPPAVVFAAASLDGMNELSAIDPGTGRVVRVVHAVDGVRPTLVLADEYLAAGRYQVQLSASRTGPAPRSDVPVARVTVTTRNGTVACREDVPAGLIPEEGFGPVWVPCELSADGPATLVVDALGLVDLRFSEVTFIRQPAGR